MAVTGAPTGNHIRGGSKPLVVASVPGEPSFRQPIEIPHRPTLTVQFAAQVIAGALVSRILRLKLRVAAQFASPSTKARAAASASSQSPRSLGLSRIETEAAERFLKRSGARVKNSEVPSITSSRWLATSNRQQGAGKRP